MRILRSERIRTPAIEAQVCTGAARLVNISATGALVRSESPWPEGYECAFVLGASNQPVRCKVRVVWARPSDDNKQYLVAVRFTDLPPLAKALVSALRGTASERNG